MVYRAGIVGCGRIGCGFDDDPRRPYVSTHAGAYKRTTGVELVALCDSDERKLTRYGERFEVSGRYRDAHEMLERERLDIVSICTWNQTHLDLVRAAVHNEVKAIFCEKPIADSLDSADQMVALCRARNVGLMIDHQRRFHPVHQRLAAWLRAGGLGRIQQVTCYYTAGVANTGSHLFDLLRFYLGEVEWVQGRLSANPSPTPADPNVDGWLGFDNGAVAALQACDINAYLIFELCLLGTRGRLRVKSSGFELELEEARDSEMFAGYKELCSVPPPADFTGDYEFMLHAVAHLLECLDSDRRPVSTGEDGRAALEIILALIESAKAGGRRMDLPLHDGSTTVESR